jgi:dihydrolipoamide dehydrogenase
MDIESYDIIVVGGGVGGYTTALRAAEAGRAVALVEGADVGGTCLNIGCIPTKALIESCRVARTAERAHEFGVTVGKVGVLPERMVARSRTIVETLRKGVEDELAAAGVAIVRGTGRLLSPAEVTVRAGSGDLTLKGGSIVVATGSSWISLPGIEIDGRQVITSDHALSLQHLPRRIVIVGGGAIGCEFAEIYRTLGAQVTVIEMMDHILPGEDAELARRLEAALRRKGITITTGTKVGGIDQGDEGVRVMMGGDRTMEADQVLMAIGRAANTAGLGLEEVGVTLSGRAVSTDEGMRTNVPGIFAVGDVTGKWLLAHVALMQGVVAATNACGGNAVMDYRAVPRCVYTDPELAAVGLAEAEARGQGKRPKVFRARLGRIGRALTLGETFGMAKVVYEETTGEVLGFQALAPHASELLSEISLAIGGGMDIADIEGVIHPHPTLSELVWECFDGAAREFRKSS